jgi:hypothetical protein
MGLVDSLIQGAKTAEGSGLMAATEEVAQYDPASFVPTGEDWFSAFEQGTDKTRGARLADLRAYQKYGSESGNDVIANLGPKIGGYNYTALEPGTGGGLSTVEGIYQPKLSGGRTRFTAEQEEYMHLLTWEDQMKSNE